MRPATSQPANVSPPPTTTASRIKPVAEGTTRLDDGLIRGKMMVCSRRGRCEAAVPMDYSDSMSMISIIGVAAEAWQLHKSPA